MTHRTAPFLTILMALSLLMAMVGHGYAQAQPPQSDLHVLVICGDAGLEIITVDGDGKRVAPFKDHV